MLFSIHWKIGKATGHGEPIDFEELEVQWMEEQIRKKKDEPQQLKGKRMRDDAVNAACHLTG